MADRELVDYIRKHAKKFGPEAIREQLLRDGVAAGEIDAALSEATAAVKRPKLSRAKLAVLGGAVLLVLAVLLSMPKPGEKPPESSSGSAAAPGGEEASADERVYRGHYGYIFKLPLGYEASGGFRDPYKTEEVVHIYPKGTDPTHFIHEGLYGSLGILKLEITRRRVPQGFIGIETLRDAISRRMEAGQVQASFRDVQVHGMPAFVVNAEKPFKYAKAYIIGEKVRYTLTGGEESPAFSEILQSLLEVSPHERAGKAY